MMERSHVSWDCYETFVPQVVGNGVRFLSKSLIFIYNIPELHGLYQFNQDF
jgi:hypothetical protein